MTLKEYIKTVIAASEPGDIDFEISLYSDGTVADSETGNKITFRAYKK